MCIRDRSDPEHMMIYSDYLYQIGLIDANGKDTMKTKESKIVSYIQKKKWTKAFSEYRQLLLSSPLDKQLSLFTNLTGFSFMFNFLFPSEESYIKFGNLSEYVHTKEFRKALHLGNAVFNLAGKVADMMELDLMQSVKPWVEILVENYRVLMYSGQLDIIVGYPLTLGFHQALNWSG